LNKYYTAFDFANKRVGFALAAEDSQDICEVDLPLDITHVHETNTNNDGGIGNSGGGDGGDGVDEYIPPADFEDGLAPIAPAPPLSKATAPPTGRDPTKTSVYLPGSPEDGGPQSQQQFQESQQDIGFGQILLLSVLLSMGFVFLISLVYKRQHYRQGEKFQEMVRRAEVGSMHHLGDDDNIIIEVTRDHDNRNGYNDGDDGGDEDRFVLDVQTIQRMN
jgi:hypothetical protein